MIEAVAVMNMRQSMSTIRTVLGRFRRDRAGIAATEFAFILPVMTLLFFGMLELSDLQTVSRRLANASNALVDLVAQEPTITHAEVDDAIIGITRLLEPTDTSQFIVRVISVTRGTATGDSPKVGWSRDQTGAAPYSTGDVYDKLDDETVLGAGRSLIVVEYEYEYASSISGRVFSNPFFYEGAAKRWPRKSAKVQLCATTDTATCVG